MKTIFLILAMFGFSVLSHAENVDLKVDFLGELPAATASAATVTHKDHTVVINLVEGLACDGKWEWSASRTKSLVFLRLKDHNESLNRKACVSPLHYRLSFKVPEGKYVLQYQLPQGYSMSSSHVEVP